MNTFIIRSIEIASLLTLYIQLYFIQTNDYTGDWYITTFIFEAVIVSIQSIVRKSILTANNVKSYEKNCA